MGAGSHRENNRQEEGRNKATRGKKRKKRGEAVESIKDGIQRKHSPPFSSFTSNLPAPFIAPVSSRDNVEQISKASI